MGWSASVGWCAVAALALVFGPAACGGSAAGSAEPKATAGTTASDGLSGGGAGVGTGGAAAGGAANARSNLVIDGLRGREGCLPRELPAVETAGGGFDVGQVRCSITEMVAPGPGAACACDASQNLGPTPASFADRIRNDAEVRQICGGASGVSCASLCLCDLLQSAGAALAQCQTDATTPIADMPPGFCYVDVNLEPPLGNPALVATCPASSRRELRILGPVFEPAPTVFLACVGSSL